MLITFHVTGSYSSASPCFWFPLLLSDQNLFKDFCSITDISIAVIDLLQEMTDVDTLNESEEGATALIDALVSFSILLVAVRQKFND